MIENDVHTAIPIRSQTERMEKYEYEDEDEDEDEDKEDDELVFNVSRKKKKKKKKKKKNSNKQDTDMDGFVDDETDATEPSIAVNVPPSESESDSDCTYTYAFLLSRLYANLATDRPGLMTDLNRRKTIRPPRISKEGSKRVAFENFAEICSSLNRPQDHLIQYITTELGSSASVDARSRLLIKGRYDDKAIESILRRYVGTYVMCGGCKSIDTLLDKDKEARVQVVRCQACDASKAVKSIQAGFVARVGARRAGRNVS